MHWTYSDDFQPDSHLEQGDILTPTDELRDVLDDAHPHFCNEKYIAFMVASQSCDLVRRKRGEPTTRYVNIVTVRSLESVLHSLLAIVSRQLGDGIFAQGSKGEARNFLSRLFDQNEQTQGLFYLHHDSNIGIVEPCVAFLRIGVALRSKHYPVLQRARSGRLKPEFRGKLGWLIGNLYARAAAKDWSESKDGERGKAELLERYLQGSIKWVEDALVEAAEASNVFVADLDRSNMDAELEKHRPPDPIEAMAKEVCIEANKALDLDEKQTEKLQNRLLNSGKLKKILKS